MSAKSTIDYSERINTASDCLPEMLRQPTVLKLVGMSLAEDLAPGGLENVTVLLAGLDITSAATFPTERILKGRIFAKKAGVIAGLPVAEVVFKTLDPAVDFKLQIEDGDRVDPGQVLVIISGNGVSLLAAERTALNFLGRLSGIASMTRLFVDAVAHTRAKILDTRKTAPGWRLLDKYAVRMGGGVNHRMGLYDQVLIKNNHIDAAGGVGQALALVKEQYGDRYAVVVEVRTLEELEIALSYHPTRILLDNMDNDAMRQAVEISAGRVPLEASGNVNLKTVGAIAETGVDYISSGALTHSAPTLDISMHLESH